MIKHQGCRVPCPLCRQVIRVPPRLVPRPPCPPTPPQPRPVIWLSHPLQQQDRAAAQRHRCLWAMAGCGLPLAGPTCPPPAAPCAGPPPPTRWLHPGRPPPITPTHRQLAALHMDPQPRGTVTRPPAAAGAAWGQAAFPHPLPGRAPGRPAVPSCGLTPGTRGSCWGAARSRGGEGPGAGWRHRGGQMPGARWRAARGRRGTRRHSRWATRPGPV